MKVASADPVVEPIECPSCERRRAVTPGEYFCSECGLRFVVFAESGAEEVEAR